MEKTVFNPEKMYTYIRGFASALHMEQTLKALTFARKKTSRSIEKKRRTLYHPSGRCRKDTGRIRHG
jgi:hypothetical protein